MIVDKRGLTHDAYEWTIITPRAATASPAHIPRLSSAPTRP
jgi:hypothetical protein